MITRQYKTNLNCGSCVAAVTPLLNGEGAIRSWRVDTTSPDKILTVEGDQVSANRVKELVGKAGFAVLGEVGEASPAPASESKPSYFPLILILGYLLVVVGMVELASADFQTMRAMRHFMAGFFLVFSFFKMLNLGSFADSYAGYDLVAGWWPPYGRIYPFIELALGLAYLVNFVPIITNLTTLIVMVISSVGVVRGMASQRVIRCACLGAVLNVPISTVTLLEDLLMVCMAGAMLVL